MWPGIKISWMEVILFAIIEGYVQEMILHNKKIKCKRMEMYEMFSN